MRKLLTALTMAALLAPAAAEAKQPYLSKAQAKRITKKYTVLRHPGIKITKHRFQQCSRVKRQWFWCRSTFTQLQPEDSPSVPGGYSVYECLQVTTVIKYGNGPFSLETWDWYVDGRYSCDDVTPYDFLPAP